MDFAERCRHFRDQAALIRRIAGGCKWPKTQDHLLTVATNYDDLAGQWERHLEQEKAPPG